MPPQPTSTPYALYPSLKDRPVLISGGASGIGAEIVAQFRRQDARVAFLDNDTARGVAHAAATGAHFIACDLRDIAALRQAVADAAGTIGTPRVLVNNAARDDRHTIESVEPEFYDDRIAVNLRHQFFAAQAVAPGMAEAGGGSIINLGSGSWLGKSPGMPVYLSAKAAVRGMTRGLARDLGPRGIRVNEVVPGWIMTERQAALWVTPEAATQNLADQCIPEWLQPEDVARMVLWLAADDSRMVTAQSFLVDAGRH